MLALSLLLLPQCGKKMDKESSEVVQRRGEGIQKVLKVARGFREEVHSDNEAKKLEAPDPKKALPDPLTGWEVRSPARGPSPSAPPTNTVHPTVNRVYGSGEKEVSIEIVDTEKRPVSLPDWTKAEEISSGKDRLAKDAGKRGQWPQIEKFSADDGEGTLEAFLAGRFLVRIQGKKIKSPEVLHTYLQLTAAGLLPVSKGIK